jgi:RNA polymerase sigma-70 factor (ECF subfamily)
MENSAGAASSQPEDLYLLIARHREDAYRLARHLVRSDAEAEDLAQSAMLNALRRADHIVDPACVRSYVLTTVRNLWRNQLRARGSRRFVGADAADMLPSGEVEPDEQVLNDLEVSLAASALGALSPTSREILELRYFEELDFPELARRLGISQVAARQRAHRAREELVGACMDRAARAGTGHCRTVRLRLGRYHRGMLSRRVRADVAEHLEQCTACATCYEQLIELYGHRVAPVHRTEVTDD